MRVRRFMVFFAALTTSCATPNHGGDVQSIIHKCGLEGQLTVKLTGRRDLRIVHLSPDAEFEKVDCFLAGVRSLKLNLGLVGNEAHPTK
jgi:hypothetical protein